MVTEIVTTGTELLLGEIQNENSRWLGAFLNEHGYTVLYMTTVGDNPERLRDALHTALSRADLVITTGGLGATQGDITKKAGADALGLAFVRIPEEAERLSAYYAEKGRRYLPAFDRQAWFAEGAALLGNPAGSASGAVMEAGGKILAHLPGPPFEMKQMAEQSLLPWLSARYGNQGIIRSLVLALPKASETEAEACLMDLVEGQTNPTIAFYARPGYIAVRLTAKGRDEESAMAMLSPLAEEICRRLPDAETRLEGDARKALIPLLEESGLTVAAAESCTGGLIGKWMTDLPGSSAYFKGSAVTYWTSAKERVLGVSPETLSACTAVSEKTAAEMAEGARALYQSDLAAATTGYAGPGRGERGEAAGLVYIAVAGPMGTVVHEEHFLGSRRDVRYGAADQALFYLAEYIRNMQKRTPQAFPKRNIRENQV